MTAAQTEIHRIVHEQGGLICRRRHPDLIGSIDAHLMRGRLVQLLPGVYAVAEAAYGDPSASPRGPGRSPYRRSNKQRRQIVLESRENPWSPPERLAHRLLRDAGITGWVGNLRVVVRGHPYYVDIGFPEINLDVEIDGCEFHTAAADFEKDRWRQNDLVNAGWRVLRFTARMLEATPQLVLAVIAEALTG